MGGKGDDHKRILESITRPRVEVLCLYTQAQDQPGLGESGQAFEGIVGGANEKNELNAKSLVMLDVPRGSQARRLAAQTHTSNKIHKRDGTRLKT